MNDFPHYSPRSSFMLWVTLLSSVSAYGATHYRDFDGDGYGTSTSITVPDLTPPVGYSSMQGDCDDGRSSFYPGTPELPDSLDIHCNGINDDGLPGSRDNAFSADGLQTTRIGGASDVARALVIQPDGKIIAAGHSSNGCNEDFAFVRLLAGSMPQLVNGGFEANETLGGGLATIFSDWRQDIADRVTAENGITPFEVTRMLKFNGTTGTGSQAANAEGDVSQFVDMSENGTSPEFDGHYGDDVHLAVTTGPDIQVEQPAGTPLADGISTVNYGITPLGTPVTRTFRVRNTGGVALDVTALTLPEGYEVVGGFTPFSLASGAIQDLDVRLLSNSVPGTYSGALTLVSNDPDEEGTFTTSLTGRAALVYPGAVAIKVSNPAAVNGIYTLDPDGPAGESPFDAYCDMTTNGGGWTLLLKANGAGTTFQYNSALWTNTTTLNPDSPGLDTTEFKSPGFSSIPFNAIMVGVGSARLSLSLLTSFPQTSLRSMFNGGSIGVATSRAAWLSLSPNPGSFNSTAGAQTGGVNVGAANPSFLRVRIGMVMNNESDMITADAYVGVGASSYIGGALTTTAGSSNYLSGVHYPGMGYVFVRDTTAGSVPSYAATGITGAATSVGTASATLNGTVNSNGISTNAWIEWGLTTSYGNSTTAQAMGYGTSAVPLSAAISGLTPGTLYHFRLVAQNGVTTAYGADQTFTTLDPGFWYVQRFEDHTNFPSVATLSTADALIASGARIARGTAAQADLYGSSSLNPAGRFALDYPLPGYSGNRNNYAVKATARFVVTTAGDYTFAANTDDGVRIRIDGTTIIADDGLQAQVESPYVVVNLSAGTHRMEWVWFEHQGADVGEVFAAPGVHTSFNSSFKLVGDPTLFDFASGTPEIAIEQPAATDLTSGVAARDFGSVDLGSTASLTFTVRNTGTADLNDLDIVVGGTNAADLRVTASPVAPVIPGGSTTFTVRFAPIVSGSKSATLQLASNDTDEPSFGISLTGYARTPRESWRQQYFGTTANSGNAADTANPDGDGLNNLLELAFGTDPTTSNNGVIIVSSGVIVQHGSPTVQVQPIPNSVDFRALFGRRKDYLSAGLTYTVQFSADLSVWQNSTATPTVIADDGVIEACTVPYPFFIHGKEARFFRVNVTLTP